MIKYLCILLMLLGCADMAHAANTITVAITGTDVLITVNANTLAVLTRLMTKENARRTAQSPPLTALTMNEFTRDLLIDMFRGYKVQTAGDVHRDTCARLRALTAGQQAAELARVPWNGDDPCP